MAGFGTARGRVMGASSAPATPAQVDSMRALVAGAMREGAFGVGAGLFYAPQFYSSTEEVIAVLKGATPYGGVYDSHQRDESSYTIGLLNSVREAIRIGRETGLTTNIGHVKALGVDVWGYADSVLALMRAARAGGQQVFADQYAYPASGTSLGALLPRWVQAGGRDSLLARIADQVTRERLLVEMRDNLRRRGGDSTLLFTGRSPAASAYLGKTLNHTRRSHLHRAGAPRERDSLGAGEWSDRGRGRQGDRCAGRSGTAEGGASVACLERYSARSAVSGSTRPAFHAGTTAAAAATTSRTPGTSARVSGSAGRTP
jgi:N-acyl-D-aspartate/D-glutamate deacylase